MKYMGSKNKYAKDILKKIKEYGDIKRPFVEPFCGGCNVIDKVNIRLFNWNDKIPWTLTPKYTLKNYFNIEWVKDAFVEKIENNKIIKLSTEKNFLTLTLNDNKTKVNLKINDNKNIELIIDKELNVYTNIIRIANDSNEYLIEMFKAIQNDWEPPKFISEKEYNDIKNNISNYPKYLVGFVGFNASFGTKFFGGYARNKDRTRKYSTEGYYNLMKQKDKIKNIIFYNENYNNFPIPDNSIIYCDPPYQNTAKYKDEINYIEFWNWCRLKVKNGHQIFISEYNAPEDFICIWSKVVSSSIDIDTGAKQNIEKLFIHNSLYEQKENKMKKLNPNGLFGQKIEEKIIKPRIIKIKRKPKSLFDF